MMSKSQVRRIEKQLREQIAQEIEALKTADNFVYDVCANIARGTTIAEDATVESNTNV